jgi:DNA polymerase elongation subunit (family B)
MSGFKVPIENIEKFLSGHGEEKYIVNIEYDMDKNLIYKVKDIPGEGIKIETEPLKAFMWVKNLKKLSNILSFYGDDKLIMKKKMVEYGIEIKPLRHDDHQRLKDGYTYLVTCEQGYKRMQSFFYDGGINIYSKFEKRIDVPSHFTMLSPIEQYFIGTGNRLFKGFESYDEINKFTFDLETTGLDPNTCKIFLIGCKNNKGYEKLIDVADDDESERQAIIKFFDTIDELKPTVISGYNSANFDWYFIFTRCKILGLDIEDIAKTLRDDIKIWVKQSMLKLGNEVETYVQTNMFGYSIIDINHATRRAQAIDSSMKSTSLKYVCKYNKVAKKNRVYIVGDKIGKLWNNQESFFFDDNTGSYSKNKPNIEYQDFITMVDEHPDKIFLFGDNDKGTGYGGQAKEMRNKANTIGIPTKKLPDTTPESYYTDAELDDNKKKINASIKLVINEIKKGKTIVIPSAGIGTGLSKLREKAPKTFAFLQGTLKALERYVDSYEEVNSRYLVERYLMDDLWETMEVDNIYNQSSFMLAKLIPTSYQRVTTMGTAGLWKMLMFTWSYENGLAIPLNDQKRDFVGGLSRLYKVGFSKKLRKADYSSLYPAVQLAHDVFPSVDITGVMKSLLKYFHSERFRAKDLAKKFGKEGNSQMKSFYERKQLPLKIFINSMFGALGAPTAFNWAEVDASEGITCRARQYLRLMVKFFMKKGYTPLVLDTDGVNFMAPKENEDFIYIGKGINEATKEGKEYTGVDAVIAEFNDLYMKGEMGLSLDGTWPATINLARKNYAMLEDDGEIKLTGNTIKSKKMSIYVEEFLDKAIILLLNEKGYEFVQFYNSYVERIYNGKIPLSKIATKARVKRTIQQYQNRGLNKAGKPLPKQAHMEMAIKNNLSINLGDVIYYVNNGAKKSNADSQGVKRPKKGWKDIHKEDYKAQYGKELTDNIEQYNKLNCYILDPSVIENEPNKVGEYNVERYLDAFNKKVKPLLVVFSEDVRSQLLITKPENKKDWLISELELINGVPYREKDQDTIQELFTPAPLELKYWDKFGYNPDIWFDEHTMFTVPGLDRTVEV